MKRYLISYMVNGDCTDTYQEYVIAKNKYLAVKEFGKFRDGDRVAITSIAQICDEEIFINENTGECLSLSDLLKKMEEVKGWFD